MATPSPTPSEDNRKNNGEIAMKNALDKVMTNPVQSYDEFLNNFTYLKQGMQEKKVTNLEVTPSMSSILKRQTSPNQNKSKTDSTNTRTESSKLLPDTHDIEEEVLCDGDVTSRISQTKMIKTGTRVKIDNYVEDVDECDMEEITDDGYMASFTADKPTGIVSRLEPVAVGVQQAEEIDPETDPISDLCQSMSLEESSTDKLLMNFLADLQNEMNDNSVPNTGSQQSAGAPPQSNSATDIQEFLNRNKKQTNVSDGVNFNDDDDSDAIDLLLDDSENKNVKVTINKDELKNELEETVKEDKKARLQEIYRNALMDSEGVMRAHCDLDDLEQTVKVVEVKDLVFPGQVEETNQEPVYENETLLDFKATYRTEQSSSGLIEGEDVCTDTIEPFQLDEDFDYDNVVLTPKFSTEDLNAMKMYRTPQAVVL